MTAAHMEGDSECWVCWGLGRVRLKNKQTKWKAEKTSNISAALTPGYTRQAVTASSNVKQGLKHCTRSRLRRGGMDAAGALLWSYSTPPSSRSMQPSLFPSVFMLPLLQSHRCLLLCCLSATKDSQARRSGEPGRSWVHGHLPKEKVRPKQLT